MKTYMESMEGGKESSGGNEFTSMLWDKYLNPKIDRLPNAPKTCENVAKNYLRMLVEETIKNRLTSEYPEITEDISNASTPATEKGVFEAKHISISNLEGICLEETISTVARNFAREVFASKAPIAKEDLGEYMLEKYLSINGNAVHPNAARYLLYVLLKVLELEQAAAEKASDQSTFEAEIRDICYGQEQDHGKRDTSGFDVKGSIINKEKNLLAMCQACDEKGTGGDMEECDKLLASYFERVEKFYTALIKQEICKVALPAVRNLIKAYEAFYSTFESKVPSIERKKEDIITAVTFKNGDCVVNLLGKRQYLDKLVASVGRPTDTGKEAAALYGEIFESVRANAFIEERKSVNPLTYEAKKDIFDDIIIEYYKKRVEETCDLINVRGMLQAMKLEYTVMSALELDEVADELKEQRAREINAPERLHKHIFKCIDKCRNLASPGIKKKDNDEPREVNVIACNEGISDGEGLRVNDFLSEAIRTDTVSRYELRFFRSVYNIMPTQLSKLCAPNYTAETDEFTLSTDNEFENLSAGDYFCIYQKYMDRIGPDCKTSAIITPHVDMRWNSIVVLPELDIDYQKRLMRKIHKAMIYGFLYDRIHLFASLDDSTVDKTYKYFNVEDDPVDLMVSNKTKCDVLYEVLDALYNDRLAVSVIREYVNKLREKSKNDGYHSFEDLEFFRRLRNLKFKHVINDPVLNDSDDNISLFTVVLMYCNSLPAQNKDMAEMKTMVESIIEMIQSEMSLASSGDSLMAKVAGLLVEQFNLLVANYEAHKAQLKSGNFSDDVVYSIRRTLKAYMRNNDVERFKDDLAVCAAD